jgi:hypothetical protein
MTKDVFFNKLVNGDVWSAGVAFERTNQLPLDKYSVFESLEAANTYLAEGVAYPGQVLAVIDGEPLTATVYVIDVNAEGVHSLKEVGTKPVGDGKSIEIKNDKITIYGFEEASAQTYPRKKADGTIEWVTVQELVEGATENTITVGDEKSIVASETDTGYELAIAGYDEAEEYTVPVKMPSGAISWQEVLQPNKDIEVETIVATSIVLGDKVISAKEDDNGTVGIQIDNDLIATEKHVADNYVTIDGFDQFAEELVEIANGKTHTYVVNNLTNSDSNFATLGKEDIIINNDYIVVDNTQTRPQIGDIYLIKDLAYVDRWVSAIDASAHTITLSALETEKVDLNGYATEDYVGNAVKGFVKSVNLVEPDEIGNVRLTTEELFHGEEGEPLADVINLIQEQAVLKDDNGQIAEDVHIKNGNSIVLSSKGGGIKFRELDESGEFSGLYSSGSYIYVGDPDKVLSLQGEGEHLSFNKADLAYVSEVEEKQDKTLSQEVTYDREGNKSDDVETLLVNIGAKVASHEYTLEDKANKTDLNNYVVKPTDDEYVLKSVYDAHVEEFNALAREVEGIEVPDVSNKEDKGKLTAGKTVANPGTFYVPLMDKAFYTEGDTANLVGLVSNANNQQIALQVSNDNGVLLSTSNNTALNISGNAATATVAYSLSADAKVNVNQLIQTEGEFLTLNGGSADSRA